MSLPNPSSGDTVQATDVSGIKDHLEGAAGDTAPYHLRQSSGNTLVTMATNDGTTAVRFNDSDDVQQFAVDSNGNVTVAGTLTHSGALVAPVSTSPAQTVEGSLVWDSDDDLLTVGDGSSRQTFYPGQAAEAAWELVGKSKLTSTASSISIASISSDFLMFRVTLFTFNTVGWGGSIRLRLNNDSGSNYRDTAGTGQTYVQLNSGSSLASGGYAVDTVVIAKPLSSVKGMILGQDAHEASANNSDTGDMFVNIWDNTSDLINRIDVLKSIGTFGAGTFLFIEGAKA